MMSDCADAQALFCRRRPAEKAHPPAPIWWVPRAGRGLLTSTTRWIATSSTRTWAST